MLEPEAMEEVLGFCSNQSFHLVIRHSRNFTNREGEVLLEQCLMAAMLDGCSVQRDFPAVGVEYG